MAVNSEYRDRPTVEVAILDALVDRGEEGMTVLELRTAVDADIDRIEEALSALKDDGLITVKQVDDGDSVRVHAHDRVVPDPNEEPESSGGIVESIRDRLGL